MFICMYYNKFYIIRNLKKDTKSLRELISHLHCQHDFTKMKQAVLDLLILRSK